MKKLNIDQLKAQADQLSFDDDDASRYWEKLSLEWNYNSNHLEGNTLTYGDTMLLLLKDQAPQGGSYSMRELDEMRAHDVAIELIRQWAQSNERTITEADIRQLNKTILVRPFWKDAVTDSGNKTRKKIIPGQYKETPNHVQLTNGKIFKYAEPVEVPAKMQELLDWYQSESELHPIAKAAQFHYKFVLIHPFDDGNGRISRLLLNYHLLRSGYAPIIIKSSDKKNYLFALRQADTGDFDAFLQYIETQALKAMKLLLKAKKGEPIEEDDDWKKELTLLRKQEDKELIRRSPEIITKILITSIIPLYEKLKLELSAQFDDLFTSSNKNFRWGNSNFTHLLNNDDQIEDRIYRYGNLSGSATFSFKWRKYKKDKLERFGISIDIKFDFIEAYYSYIIGDYQSRKIPYDEIISEDDVTFLINLAGKNLLQQIKDKQKQM